jgi:hypothetical protein
MLTAIANGDGIALTARPHPAGRPTASPGGKHHSPFGKRSQRRAGRERRYGLSLGRRRHLGSERAAALGVRVGQDAGQAGGGLRPGERGR